MRRRGYVVIFSEIWRLWLTQRLLQLDYIDKQKAKHHSREKVEEVVTVDNYNSY